MPDIKTDFIRPRLRLFLSVDIVGSTAFKQSHDTSEFKKIQQDWLEPIQTFYHSFEGKFASELQKITKMDADAIGPSPFLWKILGDELIYCKEITHLHQVFTCIYVWKKVVEDYRETFHKYKKSLDLKSTLWIAGFPYLNAEMAFFSQVEGLNDEESGEGNTFLKNLIHLDKYYTKETDNVQPPSDKIIIDFIGPAMDTGFRLGQFATKHKMIISVDLAYMLSFESKWWDSIGRDKYQFKEIKVGYDGRLPLKGVTGGKPYPLVWIDMLPEKNTPNIHDEDKLKHYEISLQHRRITFRTKEIKEFCDAFLKLNDQYPIMPYINNTNCDNRNSINPSEFYDIPLKHTEKINQIKIEYRNQIEKDNLEQKNLSEKDGHTDNPPPESAAELADTLTKNIQKK
ncbi:MAG: hypothetical protein JKY45_06550 [Emcibacter sp.]|nr:hypothetical protein [Emcibacter sp.]